MAEIDCDNAIGRVVALTGDAREDRDDRGQFCVYDETFARRHADGPVETHALWVANPPNGRILSGPPQDWPDLLDWDGGFDLDGYCEDDYYTNCDLYGPPRRPRRPSCPTDDAGTKPVESEVMMLRHEFPESPRLTGAADTAGRAAHPG